MAFIKTSQLMEALNYSGGGGGIFMSNGQGGISLTLNPTLNSMIINLNIDGVLAPGLAGLSGSMLMDLVGADNSTARLIIDSFGNHSVINFRAAVGSATSPSGLVANSEIGGIIGVGYTSAGAYSQGVVGIQFYAGETWSSTANGSYISFFATTNTTTIYEEYMRIFGSGGVVIGSSFSTDPGYSNLIIIGTITVNSTSTLTGNVGIGGASTASAGLSVSSSITGTSSLVGIENTTHLTAGVNSQFLFADYCAPTFTIGSYTGVTAYSVYLGTPTKSGTIAVSVQFYIGQAAAGTTTYGIYQGGTDLNYFAGNLQTPGITMGAGTGTVTAASGVFSVTSDRRAKNSHGLFNRGLESICLISPVLFDFKDDPKHLVRAGFYTQDVESAIPEAVFHDQQNGMASLDDRPIIAALVNSIKELNKRIDELTK
jgi:hypothetical protein